MDKKGYNEVRGTYVDRVSKSGELSKLKEEPGMFQQFPLRCSVIKTVAGGRDFKTMAYKGYWRTDRGNHQVLRAARAKAYLSGPGRGDGDLEDVYHLTPARKVSGKIQVPVRCATITYLFSQPGRSVPHRTIVTKVPPSYGLNRALAMRRLPSTTSSGTRA